MSCFLIAVSWMLPACGGSAPAVAEASADPLETVTPEELFEQGVLLAEHQDYVRAEQYLVAAMQRGVDESRIMAPLLAACVRSSRLSAALSYAEPYLERHPDAWSLRLLVATIHMGLGRTEQAHTELLRVTAQRPNEATAHYMLAVLARDGLRDDEAAKSAFRRYLEIAPEGEHAEEARAALTLHGLGSSSPQRPVQIVSEPDAAPQSSPEPSRSAEDEETAL